MPFHKSLCWFVVFVAGVLPTGAFAQQNNPSDGGDENAKRVLELVPNSSASPTLDEYMPLTTAQKFKVAWKDSTDPGTAVIAAGIAAKAQLRDANPSFGQGVSGFAQNFGTASADLVVGYYMSEAIYPTILHQDPRYFRRETGGNWNRFGYAISRVFETRGDSGAKQFNFSQMAGDATTVLLSMAYYPDHRNAVDGAEKFGVRIGADFAMNIVKEFGPDIARKFSRKRRP